jgi:hypothetical protein
VLLGVVVLAAACGSQPLTITEPDSTGGEIHFEPGEVEHDSGHEGRIDDHVLEQPPIDYAMMPLIVIERTGGDFPAGFAGTGTIVPGGRVVDHGGRRCRQEQRRSPSAVGRGLTLRRGGLEASHGLAFREGPNPPAGPLR